MDKNLAFNEPLIDQQFLADLPRRRRRPKWIATEPLTCVLLTEPLFHWRRHGSSWVDDEALYAFQHSEAFVRQVRAGGARLLIVPLEKNGHIDEEEYLLKKDLVRRCRKHGLRCGVYIRSDQIYAEVFADRLKNDDLLAALANGRVPTYGTQEWRKNICFHKPQNIQRYQESIRRAVVDLGVDYLHLDGFEVGGTETYWACRCAACRRDFTRFLQQRYGADPWTCKRRFGHTHLEAIEPPGLIALPAIPTGQINDPVWQEWIRFRCTWTARIARTISAYVSQLNPEVAIAINCSLAVRENAALLCGFDVPSAGEHLDLIMNEDGFNPQIQPDGRLLHRARQHRLVQAAGCWLWNNHSHGTDVREQRRQWAHAAAFNQGRVTRLALAGADEWPAAIKDQAKRFTAWLEQHWAHFQGLQPLADVTVWRDSKSMAFAGPQAYATAMQVEQLLVEDRIPFTIAFDFPAGARTLVLPDLLLLDDAQCAAVVQFVRRGGSLLMIGQSSTLDGWGRRRYDFGLRPILPPSVRVLGLVFNQHIAGANDPVQEGYVVADKNRWAYHRAGRGRVVYLEQLVDPASQPSLLHPDHTFNFGLDTTNWRVPDQADELRRALAWLADNRATMRVEAERGVIASYYQQPRRRRYQAHLVNVRNQPVANVVLRLELPAAKAVTSVQALSPDGNEFAKAEWRQAGNSVVVALEKLDVYTILTVQTR